MDENLLGFQELTFVKELTQCIQMEHTCCQDFSITKELSTGYLISQMCMMLTKYSSMVSHKMAFLEVEIVLG